MHAIQLTTGSLTETNSGIYLYERRQRLNASKLTRALNRCKQTRGIYFHEKEREPFRQKENW